jgi:hypothetical protein
LLRERMDRGERLEANQVAKIERLESWWKRGN